MRLIRLAVVLALSLLLPIIVEAQQTPGKIPRVALFSIDLAPERITAFREGLRRLGYVEGQNIAIELRSAEGRSERLPSLATGLIELNIDVIVAGGRRSDSRFPAGDPPR